MNFLNIDLSNAINLPIFTLGPAGTSSESASKYFKDWMAKNYENSSHSIALHTTYEEAKFNTHKNEGLLLVANAYQQINNFYMEKDLKLIATFLFDTPLYGLVSNKKLPKRPLIIASHPAPIPLIKELLPEGLTVGKIIQVRSTSEAAFAVVEGKADLALTTEIAARLHQLNFVSKTRPINMLWSVFNYKSKTARELLLD
jgi:prephenate dehydratase